MKNTLKLLTGLLITFGLLGNVSATDINLMPMYGKVEKTKEQIKSDDTFIESITSKGLDRKKESQQVAKKGWKYFSKGDWKTAMKRFNQAWLLDPDNSGSYHGFAIISADQGKHRNEVEEYFKKALSKSNAGPSAHVDYGRYLWTQSDFNKSILQLQKTIEHFPTAYNARSNLSFVYYRIGNSEKACYWAKEAKKYHDDLQPGYLEAMCSNQSE